MNLPKLSSHIELMRLAYVPGSTISTPYGSVRLCVTGNVSGEPDAIGWAEKHYGHYTEAADKVAGEADGLQVDKPQLARGATLEAQSDGNSEGKAGLAQIADAGDSAPGDSEW